MYKILHFITGSTYAEDFIKFISKNYGVRKDVFHKVYVISNHERVSIFPSEKYQFEFYNFKGNGNQAERLMKWFISGQEKRTAKEIESFDRIVIHGLFNPALMIMLRMHPSVLKKTYIILWGGDFYDHLNAVKPDASIEKQIEEILKRYIYNQVPLIGMDMPTDYPLLHEWYGVSNDKTKIVYLKYPQLVESEALKAAEGNKQKKNRGRNNAWNIQVGNSATETNQHIDAFHKLSQYKNENIRIFCPLAYGDKDYADMVTVEGHRIFGDKFIAVNKLMNPEEYCSFLSGMDIAVFNNNRQQGMANIALLSYLGTKMYIRNDTSMWEQYVVKDGCRYTSVGKIENTSFEDFIHYEKKDREVTSSNFAYMWDNDSMMKLWNPILESLSLESRNTSVEGEK